MRRQAIERIRQAVWQMRSTEDIHTVLQVMQAELRQLGIVYQALGVNLIDLGTEEVTARYRARSLPGEERWTFWNEQKAGIRRGAIIDFWKGRKVAYRPDLHLEDLYGERVWADRHPGRPARCVLDVPFSHGTLALNSPLPDAFSAEDIQTIQEIAGVLSQGFLRLGDLWALEQRAQEAEALSAALKASTQRLELLVGLSKSIAVTLDLDSVLQQALQQLSGIFASLDLAILYLWEPQERALVPRAWLGVNGEAIALLRLESGESISGKVFQTGQAVFTRTQEEAAALRGVLRLEHARLFVRAIGEMPIQGNLCAPLRTHTGEVLGTITVSSTRGVFTEVDLALLEGVAGQLAQAIDNAQLYAQAKGFSRRLVQSQEKERRRVARELHDGLGQSLTAIRFQVQKAARQFAHDPAGTDLREIDRHLQDAIQETRALSHDLRPSILDDLGLVAALRALCRGFGERTGLPMELELDEEVERLPAEVETALYRIAQEGLHNVERHARARRAQVCLRRLAGEVVLEIRDEGQGMAEGQVLTGMGLTNMRERAALIGGQLEVESAPGRGVLLRVRVPLVPAAPAG